MKYTLVIYWFLAFGDQTTTESLGDFETESLCHWAAEQELQAPARSVKWKGEGFYREPYVQEGAWVAVCIPNE